MNNKQKLAFTLAEVLITLAIIGVVAVMTVAVLAFKIQKNILKVQFKKEYSLLQNALKLTNEEGLLNCYLYYPCSGYQTVTSQCADVKNRLVEILNAKEVPNVYKNNYKKFNQLQSEDAVFSNGSVNYDNFLNYSRAYQLKDGSVFLINNVWLILDVNGLSGPNKFGYDVFYMHFYLDQKNNRIITTNYLAGIKEKGGAWPEEIINSKEINNYYIWQYRQFCN